MPVDPFAMNIGPRARLGQGAVLLCAIMLLVSPARAAMVGDVHDFVDDGFTGGGVCAACHTPHDALDDRLYPRAMGASGADVPRLLCLDCHDGVMPTGNGWPASWGNGDPEDDFQDPPPALPVSHGAGFNACTSCHQH